MLLAFLSSCAPRRRQANDSSPGTLALPAPTRLTGSDEAEREPSNVSEDVPDFARGCLTLRDVAASDVVRVDGSWLYYVDESSGLRIVDVSDPDHPRVASQVPHVGSPLYLFVRSGIAWVIFVDWDHRWAPRSAAATVIRAIDVRNTEHPTIFGEAVRDGITHDARLVGGLLYVLGDQGNGSIVESFGVARGSARRLGHVDLDGHAVELAASSAGLAAITTESDVPSVTWLDLPTASPGAIEPRGRVSLHGGIPSRRIEGARIADADDGQRVHVVTCETATCGAREGSRLHVIDFAATPPRTGPSVLLAERGGLPVTRFIDDRAYAAASTDDETLASGAGPSSELRVVELYPWPRLSGGLRLRGTATTLVPREGSLVVLGRVSSSDGRGRLLVHDVDVRRASTPRLRGTATFGSDWTWSVAEDTGAAMSFDPSSRLAAVPFTAVRESDRRYGVGTQLIELGSKPPKLGSTLRADEYVERAVFLGSRLLMIGPLGIETVDLRGGLSGGREGAARRP